MRQRAICAATLCVLACLAGCQGSADVQVPSELIGRWRTDAPDYADRFILILPNAVFFGTGGDNYVIHPIVDAEAGVGTDPGEYTIGYSVGGKRFALSLLLYGKGGQMRLRNQPRITWQKG